MSRSLTVCLAIVGGIILVVVVVHSVWTVRKATLRLLARTQADQHTAQTDCVSNKNANEPHWHDSIIQADMLVLPTSVLRRPIQRLDPLIDAIAIISIEHALSGDYLIAHMPASRRAGSKPMLIEGLSADSGEWEPLQKGVLYSEVQVGVLIANRLGALNEIEYSEFVQKTQAFADTIGGAVDVPDMLDVVARAKEIDAFAVAHDAQIAMRLIALGSMWSLGFIQQQVSKHGFLPGMLPGRMVLPAQEEGAPPLLTLQYDAQLAMADKPDRAGFKEVLLVLDVPQTAVDEAPFERWSETAQVLAQSLDAFMADDQGQAFLPQAFQKIQIDLQRLYDALARRELAAGSAAARRLFS